MTESTVLLATAAVVILVLLWVLIWGQPASVQALRDQHEADATTIAGLRVAQPTKTPRLCPGYVQC